MRGVTVTLTRSQYQRAYPSEAKTRGLQPLQDVSQLLAVFGNHLAMVGWRRNRAALGPSTLLIMRARRVVKDYKEEEGEVDFGGSKVYL
jgi:hypothetical protein